MKLARVATVSVCLSLFAALSSGAAEPATGFLTRETDKLYFESAGEGPAVILLHDGVLGRETWDEQFGSFAKSFRVIRYDRPGYGRSAAATGSFSNLDDLEALYAELGVSKASLVGCSYGGRIAIDFAIAHPDRVTSLVLVGAVVGGFPFSDFDHSRGGYLKGIHSIPDAKDWENDPYFVLAENKDARRRVKAILSANPENVTAGMQPGAGLGTPALGRLGEIKVPTLILVGGGDIADVHANSGVLHVGIPGSRRVVIPGAGHLVHLEKPQEFDSLVLRFLTKPPLPLPRHAGAELGHGPEAGLEPAIGGAPP